MDILSQCGVRAASISLWRVHAPAAMREADAARLGIDCGRSIPPVTRLTDDQRREVAQEFKRRRAGTHA